MPRPGWPPSPTPRRRPSVADRQQAGLAEHAIGIRHVVHRRDRVFAGHQPQQLFAIGRAHPAGQLADHLVQLGHRRVGLDALRPAALRGVVQVRQVDIEEVGPPLLRGQRGRIGDPPAGLDAGHRAPKILQRKVAQAVAERAVEFRRPRIAPERFRAVGVVDRGRRADVIGLAALAVQGEPDGRTQATVPIFGRRKWDCPLCPAPARPRSAAARCNRSARSTFPPAPSRQ